METLMVCLLCNDNKPYTGEQTNGHKKLTGHNEWAFFNEQEAEWEAIQQEYKDAWIAYTQDFDNYFISLSKESADKEYASWERWNRAWKAYFGTLRERLEAIGEWERRAELNPPLEWDKEEK